jgi:hypothetical protein
MSAFFLGKQQFNKFSLLHQQTRLPYLYEYVSHIPIFRAFCVQCVPFSQHPTYAYSQSWAHRSYKLSERSKAMSDL